MTWREELSGFGLLGGLRPERAVGWLDPDHPFSTGDPPPGFREALARCPPEDVQEGWVAAGIEPCELCTSPRGSPDAREREEHLELLRELRRQARAGTLTDRQALRDAERRQVELVAGSGGGGSSFLPGEMVGQHQVVRVRTAGAVYVAPDLIHHYVATHRYLPPREFVEAVLALPAAAAAGPAPAAPRRWWQLWRGPNRS